jgi:hypothetical protein
MGEEENEMKMLVVIMIALTLLGCAGPQKFWYREDATIDQTNRDRMACRQYGMQSAMANGLAGNMFVEMWIQGETRTCMQNLGYSLR